MLDIGIITFSHDVLKTLHIGLCNHYIQVGCLKDRVAITKEVQHSHVQHVSSERANEQIEEEDKEEPHEVANHCAKYRLYEAVIPQLNRGNPCHQTPHLQ